MCLRLLKEFWFELAIPPQRVKVQKSFVKVVAVAAKALLRNGWRKPCLRHQLLQQRCTATAGTCYYQLRRFSLLGRESHGSHLRNLGFRS